MPPTAKNLTITKKRKKSSKKKKKSNTVSVQDKKM